MTQNMDLLHWQTVAENARRKEAEALRENKELRAKLSHLEKQLAKLEQGRLDLAMAARIYDANVNES